MSNKRPPLQTDDNTGFGFNRALYGKRFLTPEGRPNVKLAGLKTWERLSWYHTLIGMGSAQFLAVIFGSFILFNILFAAIYLSIGIDHLSGIEAKTELEKVSNAFFFSTQTFTTVGYGRINPTGYLTSFVASFQAFCGLLYFAVATGLFYARFSRPKAFVRFSRNALIAPYKDGAAVMIRLAPYKNNALTEAEIKVVLALAPKPGTSDLNKFYALPLERSKIDALFSSWTVVHPIDELSPLAEMSLEEIRNTEMELIVYLKAFDDTFSNTVVARASYMSDQIIPGARFSAIHRKSTHKGETVVDISRLDHYELTELHEPAIASSSS
ncbi:MAG TPA: ion channel [Flavitalea sp.]|nr:ion channel [Flavitalea sp.]